LAMAVARAIRAVDRDLAFVVMPGTASDRAAERTGLRPIREVYADRTYADSFNLTPRSRPDAMIHDPATPLARVLEMVGEGRIVALSGKMLRVQIDSVCVHGDSPQAVATAQRLRAGLEAAGYTLRPATAP
ncbi:MAG: LamB/YcsF family protein, partial [Alphaproteobacteria bacterium]|nr:LamB/YcsF family protein [Alphaproteobacteria bacterium]